VAPFNVSHTALEDFFNNSLVFFFWHCWHLYSECHTF
jgi:hypothetical protein